MYPLSMPSVWHSRHARASHRPRSQGHLTQCLGIDHDSIENTLYSVLIEKTDIREIIINTKMKNLKLIPANLDLSPVELALTSMNAREQRLRKSITAIQDDYDVIVMDASPSIGLLNLNGILACNDLFVPVLADFLSYHGLKILFETLSTIEEDFEFIFENIYIFLNITMHRTISARGRKRRWRHTTAAI